MEEIYNIDENKIYAILNTHFNSLHVVSSFKYEQIEKRLIIRKLPFPENILRQLEVLYEWSFKDESSFWKDCILHWVWNINSLFLDKKESYLMVMTPGSYYVLRNLKLKYRFDTASGPNCRESFIKICGDCTAFSFSLDRKEERKEGKFTMSEDYSFTDMKDFKKKPSYLSKRRRNKKPAALDDNNVGYSDPSTLEYFRSKDEGCKNRIKLLDSEFVFTPHNRNEDKEKYRVYKDRKHQVIRAYGIMKFISKKYSQ